MAAPQRAGARSRPAPGGRAPGATVRLRATPPHSRRRPPGARALPEWRPEPDRVQCPGTGAGGGSECSAPCPDPISLHPEREPGRVFHGARRHTETRGSKRWAGGGGAPCHRDPGAGPARAAGSLFQGRVPPGSRRAWRQDPAVVGRVGCSTGGPAPLLLGGSVSLDHAAGHDPRAWAPLPTHSQLAPLPRHRGARRAGRTHALCLPEGAGDAPRFLTLADGSGFVAVEDVIRANLSLVYPGRFVEEAYAFRVTRGADLELDEQHAVSLLQVIEEETKRRPYGAAVRVEIAGEMQEAVRELLLRELQFEEAAASSPPGAGDLYAVDGLLDLGALRELARLPLPELDYPPHHGRAPLEEGRSIFAILAERDVLVHHPYDAFEATVQRLVVEAADDPDVVAIKLTLYRAGGRSEIVEALLRAAGRGKEVFVFVELKARFDEERNIEWAKKLEEAGIRVVYGLVELKTHAKTALIVRREQDGIRRYVHIGTGNYNAATAAIYTDVGLLSADPELGADLNDLFNELSGSSRPPQTAFRRILVSPTYLANRLIELIDREAAHARAGRAAWIRAKLNGLADPEVITALYRASQAGVDVGLVVRGVCTLRPGVVGLSERIRVISVLGRFLEHARIYAFANGDAAEYYIGSADWRPRNLRHRVEVVTPVRDAGGRNRLAAILAAELDDPTAWDLDPDGVYHRRAPLPGGDPRSSQERLLGPAGATA